MVPSMVTVYTSTFAQVQSSGHCQQLGSNPAAILQGLLKSSMLRITAVEYFSVLALPTNVMMQPQVYSCIKYAM